MRIGNAIIESVGLLAVCQQFFQQNKVHVAVMFTRNEAPIGIERFQEIATIECHCIVCQGALFGGEVASWLIAACLEGIFELVAIGGGVCGVQGNGVVLHGDGGCLRKRVLQLPEGFAQVRAGIVCFDVRPEAGGQVLARMWALVFKRQVRKKHLCRRGERHKGVIEDAFDLPKQTDMQHEFAFDNVCMGA